MLSVGEGVRETGDCRKRERKREREREGRRRKRERDIVIYSCMCVISLLVGIQCPSLSCVL